MNREEFQLFILQAAYYKAFEAGRLRGRDEMHGGTEKYHDEITVNDFDMWYAKEMKLEQATQKGQDSE